jgi:hypothetical protein
MKYKAVFLKEDEWLWTEAKKHMKRDKQNRLLCIQDFMKDGECESMMINDCNGNYYSIDIRKIDNESEDE